MEAQMCICVWNVLIPKNLKIYKNQQIKRIKKLFSKIKSLVPLHTFQLSNNEFAVLN